MIWFEFSRFGLVKGCFPCFAILLGFELCKNCNVLDAFVAFDERFVPLNRRI